jgi:predicted ribosome quality control (RQC) complex YloA/Tae2 family protein
MKKEDVKPNVWTYVLPGGWEVLAGKSDADNDLLSLRVARGTDLWFHVHGVSGSHVILRGPEGEKPARDLIRKAAAIAAWHSKARTAGTVPVSFTQAAHVSKPRGAKPGLVVLKKSETLKVRPADPEPNSSAFGRCLSPEGPVHSPLILNRKQEMPDEKKNYCR